MTDLQHGPWTEADYHALGELHHRIELLDGYLRPCLAPTMAHQDVSHLIVHALRLSARRADLRAYESVVLRLGEGQLIVPDLLIARVNRLAGFVDAIDTVMVGEILSPGNPAAETPHRIELCAAAGIEWLLLAQPETAAHEALALRLFRLQNGRYLEHRTATPGDTLFTTTPFPFRIRTADLVAF